MRTANLTAAVFLSAIVLGIVALLAATGFDVSRAALFDTSAAVQAAAGVSALPASLPIKASVTRYAPGKADIQLDTPAPAGSALLVSENFYPGWTATVDGKPAVTARADYTLIGVQLPAGARKISLTFDSQEYHTGKAVTLVAILAALVALAAGLVIEKRKVA